jgi:hypothetical protein
VISFSCCSSNNTKTYARLIIERIDKYIEITTRGVGGEDGNDKRKRKRKNDDDLSIDIKIKNDKNYSRQQHSVILQEKVLHLASRE